MSEDGIFTKIGRAIDGANDSFNEANHKLQGVIDESSMGKAAKHFDAMLGNVLVSMGHLIKGDAQTVSEPTKQGHAVAPEHSANDKIIRT